MIMKLSISAYLVRNKITCKLSNIQRHKLHFAKLASVSYLRNKSAFGNDELGFAYKICEDN
jgi:hypothetical protein